MIEQRRKNGPVALLLDSFLTVRGKQLAGLVIPNCRRLAFAAPQECTFGRPLRAHAREARFS